MILLTQNDRNKARRQVATADKPRESQHQKRVIEERRNLEEQKRRNEKQEDKALVDMVSDFENRRAFEQRQQKDQLKRELSKDLKEQIKHQSSPDRVVKTPAGGHGYPAMKPVKNSTISKAKSTKVTPKPAPKTSKAI